jgi:hypothetical protein
VIALLSIALALYEALALATGRRTVSHATGAARIGVATWFVALGIHFVYEWVTDDIGEAAANSLGE